MHLSIFQLNFLTDLNQNSQNLFFRWNHGKTMILEYCENLNLPYRIISSNNVCQLKFVETDNYYTKIRFAYVYKNGWSS